MSRAEIRSPASVPLRYTGHDIISQSVVEDRRWKIRDIKLHLSGIGDSGNFTMTINSVQGTEYDIVIFFQDMTSIYDLVWVPKADIIIESMDILRVTWTNPQGRIYGLEIRQDFV